MAIDGHLSSCLRRQLTKQVAELVGELGLDLGGIEWFGVESLEHRRRRVRGRVGKPVGEQFESQNTKTEYVDSFIDRFTPDQLWGHVLEGPGPVSRSPKRRRVGDCEPEIDQLDLMFAAEQEISRVDVVVNESRRMDGGKARGRLGEPLHPLGGPPEFDIAEVLKAVTVDKIHHQVMLAAGRRPILKGAHDVRMDHLNGDRPLLRSAFLT